MVCEEFVSSNYRRRDPRANSQSVEVWPLSPRVREPKRSALNKLLDDAPGPAPICDPNVRKREETSSILSRSMANLLSRKGQMLALRSSAEARTSARGWMRSLGFETCAARALRRLDQFWSPIPAPTAHDHGHDVTLVIDAATGTSSERHEQSIKQVFPHVRETVTTDDLLTLVRTRSTR